MKRLLSFIAVCAGCTSHAPWLSLDVGTRDIAVAVEWKSDARLSATVSGPGGAITFEGGERVYLLRGAREIPLVREGDAWRADLGGEVGAFVLAIDRARDADARVSFEVPAPFTVTAPASASRHDPLTLAWDPSPTGVVAISIQGPCIAPFQRGLATDTGRYTINAGEIAQASAGACVVEVAITRTITGGSSSTNLQSFSYRASREARTTTVSLP